MRRPLVFAAIAVVAACKKSAPAPGDAGTTKAVPDPIASTSAAASASAPPDDEKPIAGEREEDASVASERPPVPAQLPTAKETFELVAVGKAWGSKLVWLKQLGSRIWLSGKNVDAYSDGDGPLVPAPDLLKGLSYQGSKHVIWVAGAYPRLYALRIKNVSYRVESQETTAFALSDGKWIKAEPLLHDHEPHAFITWGDGALMVWSAVVNATVQYVSGQGTELQTIGPDGKLGDPGLQIDPAFVAWDASSDGTTLSLLGSRGGARKDTDMFERGIWVVRGSKATGMKLVSLLPNVVATSLATLSDIDEMGQLALVKPGYGSDWGKVRTVFFVGDDGNPKTRVIGIAPCDVFRQKLVGETLWAIETCDKRPTGEHKLVRVSPDGKTERIELPYLVKGEKGYRAGTADEKGALRCDPWNLVSRGPDDLWIELECGRNVGDMGGRFGNTAMVSAVLRRGHPQEPVLLP